MEKKDNYIGCAIGLIGAILCLAALIIKDSF